MISPADCKLIFGNLDQIISLHKKVEADLSKVMDSWNERSRVGECMMRSFDDFKQVYPPYVNHLDKSLALIKNFEENNPKFNAFCKARLAKGNYCRQSLSGNDSNNLWFINHRFERIFLEIHNYFNHLKPCYHYQCSDCLDIFCFYKN